MSVKKISDSGKAKRASAMDVTHAPVGQRWKTEDEMNRYSRLEMVEALAGGIAHDINNALTAIIHNVYAAKMFLSNEAKREEVPKLLDAGMKTIRRATALTHRLLAFSAEGRPFRKSIYLKNVIRDFSKFSLSGSNVRCEFHIADDLWPAYVDEAQIAQVISNIIINAKQAMPGGGTIDVIAENVNPGKDEVPRLRGGKYVKLSMRDRGVGIPKERLREILDIKKEGSGPGLAASYSIVRKNGGLITIESVEGVGTTFHVYLPASETGTETEPEGEGGVEGGNVLVMESEEDIVDSMRFAMALLGYETEFVKDGTGAIAAYEMAMRSGRPFDVMILDLTVPGGMGGVDAIRALKKIYPDVMAVIASGYSNDPVMTDFETYGFTAAIEKPHNVEDLDRLLRRLIAARGR
jgi:nitrogen-specific signal transduction histidine kinase/ActR/RegA family two-component response regulator